MYKHRSRKIMRLHISRCSEILQISNHLVYLTLSIVIFCYSKNIVTTVKPKIWDFWMLKIEIKLYEPHNRILFFFVEVWHSHFKEIYNKTADHGNGWFEMNDYNTVSFRRKSRDWRKKRSRKWRSTLKAQTSWASRWTHSQEGEFCHP